MPYTPAAGVVAAQGIPGFAFVSESDVTLGALDVDHGQLVYPSLEDVALVVDLDEFAAVSGWSPGRRDGRRFERFATSESLAVP